MDSVLSKSDAGSVHRLSWIEDLSAAERVTFVYFAYIAALGLVRPLETSQRIFLWAIPITLCAMWRLGSIALSKGLTAVREWSSLALLLGGHWTLQRFSSMPLDWQNTWLRWEHWTGLRRATGERTLTSHE